MPGWESVLQEIKSLNRPEALDIVRRKYLKLLADKTQRNIIAYYSGFLTKPMVEGTTIYDNDVNSFMTVIHNLDRSKGLDLILHTQGGDLAATECIGNYLYAMFGNDVRVIIPQLAMSAGTLLCCMSNSIIMGKQSSLGPIDPQIRGIPAQGVLNEFEQARKEMAENPATIPLWQPIISQYTPTLIGECQNAVEMTKKIAHHWLLRNMLYGHTEEEVTQIVQRLNEHNSSYVHNRHFSKDDIKQFGLTVQSLEDDNTFQDLVQTVHHAYMLTMEHTTVYKIVENQNGIGVFSQVSQNTFPTPPIAVKKSMPRF
jgi:ATP-dependent protease ClpP protease subunit